jgi:UDP-N-acetylmuramoylalanine--D-glutamate ligase
LRAYGLSDGEIKKGLESFLGVEGRLQYVRAIGEVEIYNDNNATTPNATSVALNAVAKGKNVVLICGGSDKGVELDVLIESMKDAVKHVVLYSGTGTEVLKGALPAEISHVEHDTLKECVTAALKAAAPGDVVLFSPAFASFGKEFKNEYDRNDQFLKIIRSL